jgi:hypothetical protein
VGSVLLDLGMEIRRDSRQDLSNYLEMSRGFLEGPSLLSRKKIIGQIYSTEVTSQLRCGFTPL